MGKGRLYTTFFMGIIWNQRLFHGSMGCFINYSSNQKTKMRSYTIPAGKHRSTYSPKFHFGKKRIVANVIFTESCRYNLGTPDQKDWNKLFGLSFGLDPHKNSARWSWRYNADSGLIELSPYCYLDSTRIMADDQARIISIPIGEQTELTITLDPAQYFFLYRKNIEMKPVLFTHLFYGKQPGWGLILNPYFGGNKAAQHKIEILMDIN